VVIETENRPEQLWVPSTAEALAHNDYTNEVWPSAQRFDFWIAECKSEGCNIFDAKCVPGCCYVSPCASCQI